MERGSSRRSITIRLEAVVQGVSAGAEDNLCCSCVPCATSPVGMLDKVIPIGQVYGWYLPQCLFRDFQCPRARGNKYIGQYLGIPWDIIRL